MASSPADWQDFFQPSVTRSAASQFDFDQPTGIQQVQHVGLACRKTRGSGLQRLARQHRGGQSAGPQEDARPGEDLHQSLRLGFQEGVANGGRFQAQSVGKFPNAG